MGECWKLIAAVHKVTARSRSVRDASTETNSATSARSIGNAQVTGVAGLMREIGDKSGVKANYWAIN